MSSGRVFVMADVHGEYQKMMSCLKQVNFDYELDSLIQLGDIVDRGPDSYLCVEELLKIKNLVAIKGNHDSWFLEDMLTGQNIGLTQGGSETRQSYIKHCGYDQIDYDHKIAYPQSHIDFFKNQKHYYIDSESRLFVHGGFNRHLKIEEQEFAEIFWWDRDLLMAAKGFATMKTEYPFKMAGHKGGKFTEVYVGHTPVQYFNETTPQKYGPIWDLDCGAGKYANGSVAIMNVETNEYWLSNEKEIK